MGNPRMPQNSRPPVSLADIVGGKLALIKCKHLIVEEDGTSAVSLLRGSLQMSRLLRSTTLR